MKHIKEKSTFEHQVGDQVAELNYQLNPVTNTMSVNRTYVPDSMRGQGVAGKLNKAALDFAAENKFRVVPVCSYTAAYITKHDEYEPLLQK